MNKSYLIAAALVLIVSVWLASGLVTGKSQNTQIGENTTASNTRMIVEAEWMTAQSITPFIISHGELVPDRTVTMKTETNGKVEKILVREGGVVTTGQELLSLQINDKLIRKEQVELLITERKSRLQAIRQLADQGFVSALEVETAEVELKRAEVELAQVELQIDNTHIRAPFDGILEELEVEEGQYLGIGDNLLTLVDNDPLVVKVQVPQHNVNSLNKGQVVRVDLSETQEVEGSIRFIASRGDEDTRTFRVEIEIPNEDNLRAGSSATAYIPRQAVKAHFVSGGLLSLNTAGEMGVKTVDPEGRVVFHPVKLEYSDADGMWVSGLPENSLVITSGQGFADEGQSVIISNSPASHAEQTLRTVSGNSINANLD